MAEPFVCLQCGCCCRDLITEVNCVDVVREPALAPHLKGYWSPVDEDDPVWLRNYVLAIGGVKPCPFLGDDNRCGIYPTRPNVCVSMVPGGLQCKDSRRALGAVDEVSLFGNLDKVSEMHKPKGVTNENGTD